MLDLDLHIFADFQRYQLIMPGRYWLFKYKIEKIYNFDWFILKIKDSPTFTGLAIKCLKHYYQKLDTYLQEMVDTADEDIVMKYITDKELVKLNFTLSITKGST
jgi:hypothetical protein